MQVWRLIAAGHSNVLPSSRMAAALDALIASGTSTDPAATTFQLGEGTWEVPRRLAMLTAG